MIVCALASQSCLVPQSVDPIVESPHPPPHFVLESIPPYLLPPILQLYRQGSTDAAALPPCHCQLELKIPLIEEDDPTITLDIRWFVDYDPAVPRLAAPVQTNQLLGSFDTSGTVRSYQQVFDLDADALGIASNGVHRVDVVVAETAAWDTNSTSRPNRAVLTGYTADEYAFLVNVKVDPDATRPACPSELPSVKVCQ